MRSTLATTILRSLGAALLAVACVDPARAVSDYPTRPITTVPTAEEAGLAEFHVTDWNALIASKGAPDAIVERLYAALCEALENAGTRKRLLALGSQIPHRDARKPEALATLVRAEITRWVPVISSATAQEKG
jgi:tripartite-type tricarboxylate transporter receptor subunit TctC